MVGPYVLRNTILPGDLGEITRLHGVEYARESGFDVTFEAYVAGSLADVFKAFDPARHRVWLAESGGRLVGVIAIIGLHDGTAQLRWYVVAREARGRGLGRRLLDEAIRFCRENRYQRVMLWTVSSLARAAELYRSVGFRVMEEVPRRQWGQDVIEQRYELVLDGT